MDNRRAPLYAGLAVAGVAILMVLLLVLPKTSQVSTAQDKLDQAQRDQQTLESRKSALEDAKAAAPQARKTIAEVDQRIPATAEEPGLILLLQNAALSAGIDLVSLSKETKFVNTQLAERAFSWSELLDRLEAVLPGSIRITSVSPAFADNGLVHLTLMCEGKSADSMLSTISRMQRDAHFSNPFPTMQDNYGTVYRFGIGVDFKPTVARVVP